MINLENGFYWVRKWGEWFVAEFSGGYFTLNGRDFNYEQDDFDEIDPCRIEREGGAT